MKKVKILSLLSVAAIATTVLVAAPTVANATCLLYTSPSPRD